MNSSEARSINDYATEAWENDVERYIRRIQLRKGLAQYNSIRGAIDSVRETEPAKGLVAERLLRFPNELDPKIYSILEQIFNQIRFNYEGIAAVTVFGSLAWGSQVLRDAAQVSRIPDLDWGLIVDKDKFDASCLPNLIHEVYLKLPEYCKKFGCPSMNMCYQCNPTNWTTESINSTAHAYTLLSSLCDEKVDKYDSLIKALSMSFMPSFPAEVGAYQSQLILSALREMAAREPQKWKQIIDKLIADWERHHKIYPKHLFSEPSNMTDNQLLLGLDLRSRFLAIYISATSPHIMSRALRELLESTVY